MAHPVPIKRNRTRRMAALSLQPGKIARAIEFLRRGDVLLRLSLCLVAAIILWTITAGWQPPFSFRTWQVPPRDVVARVEFKVKDDDATRELVRLKHTETPCVYKHDPRRLVEFRQGIKEKLFHVIRADAFDKLPKELQQEIFPATEGTQPGDQEKAFQHLKETFADDMDLSKFEKALTKTFSDFERDGLLEELEHKPENGSVSSILVYPSGDELAKHLVNVNDVRIPQAATRIERRLPEELKDAKYPEQQMPSTTTTLVAWIKARLPKTLTYNEPASNAEWQEVEKKIQQDPEFKIYSPGTVLATGNRSINNKAIDLLRLEHEAQVRNRTWTQCIVHSMASFGLYIALYVLCGVYIYYREPRLLLDMRRFATLLATVVVTVGLCLFTSRDHWRAEIIPLVLFGMTVTIVYAKELSMLLIASLSLAVTLALGQGLTQFVVLAATAAASVLVIGRIRSRTRLMYVGMVVGGVGFLTSVGVGLLTGQAYGAPNLLGGATGVVSGQADGFFASSYANSLLGSAAWVGIYSVMAGALMTAILPFVEKVFDVQTDISLLVLGDAAHPLLQELVRRAPGTYNHSINVASIGEAAAEAIGANGLLVRVGAYFHDIGKMLKPGYFVENQGTDVSRHSSLLPAMSTLVIIAHVKDGANLAQQHG